MSLWTKVEIVLLLGMMVGIIIMNPYIAFGCMFTLFFILGLEAYVKRWQDEL